MIKELFELSEETLSELRPSCQIVWNFSFGESVVGHSKCNNRAKYYGELHLLSDSGCGDEFKYVCEKCVSQYQLLSHECFNCHEVYALHSKIGI